MYRGQHISITGFQLVDAEDTVEQKDRASAIPQFATVAREQNAGYANWRIMRPGDPANMMYWPLDPNAPPSRGAATGSYSYAFPARRLPPTPPPPSIGPVSPITPGGPAGGSPVPAPFPPLLVPGPFLPLAVPDALDTDYEALDIQEAGPDDWIILGTTRHGDRRKLAFRPPHPIGFRLCADHRSDVAPDLSSIVHDGRPVKSLDEIRRAGLHTCWEVREWNTPGSQMNPYASGTSSQPSWHPGDRPEKYSIAWIADSAPDSTGFARIGFGDRDGLYSHMQGGPFIPSVKQKHWLATTNDGDILAGALSTNSLFRGSDNPYSAPLDFEEKKYPDPPEGTYEYKVFLWYDHNKKHPFITGQQPGMWRWFTKIPIGETPKCSPTKDYAKDQVTSSNPRRTFAENSRGIMHKKLITPGLYFSPRPNLLDGRIPGTVTKHI
jgi:hypothetical protein